MSAGPSIDVTAIPAISHHEAMELQTEELRRAVALLSALDDNAWTAQTDCPDWDVRRLYLHVLGACEAGASIRENVHQLRTALAVRKRDDVALEAALSGVQVRERELLEPGDIVARLREVTPRTIKGRRRMPVPMRKLVKIPIDAPVREKWSLGYLVGTIYLRDLWMHRVDASRATGREMQLTAEHDGRVVADIVAEWARRHGAPFALELDGAAGGHYESRPDATGAQRIALDAVEFCRTLAGRREGDGLMATIVPF